MATTGSWYPVDKLSHLCETRAEDDGLPALEPGRSTLETAQLLLPLPLTVVPFAASNCATLLSMSLSP